MKKTIVLNNQDDRNKFLKNIWKYRSIFYHFKEFELKDNLGYGDDIKGIIDALNIKDKKKRITFIYDSACENIDEYYKDKNICGFKNGKCYAQRFNKYHNGCCRKCIYQSNKGCQTKNLTCKLFNCSEVTCRNKVLKFEDLIILKVLSKRQQVIIKHDYFSSREEVLKDLFIGSLTIFGIRLTFRLLFKNMKVN